MQKGEMPPKKLIKKTNSKTQHMLLCGRQSIPDLNIQKAIVWWSEQFIRALPCYALRRALLWKSWDNSYAAAGEIWRLLARTISNQIGYKTVTPGDYRILSSPASPKDSGEYRTTTKSRTVHSLKCLLTDSRARNRVGRDGDRGRVTAARKKEQRKKLYCSRLALARALEDRWLSPCVRIYVNTPAYPIHLLLFLGGYPSMHSNQNSMCKIKIKI